MRTERWAWALAACPILSPSPINRTDSVDSKAPGKRKKKTDDRAQKLCQLGGGPGSHSLFHSSVVPKNHTVNHHERKEGK